MYVEQYLVKDRHQQRLIRAEQERMGRRIVQFRRLEKQRVRAERRLLQVWRRVDHARSIMSTG